jgi:putative DNA primase/helicase
VRPGAEPTAPSINVAWFQGIDPRAVVGPDRVTWDRLAARLAVFPLVACEKRAAPGWAPIAWAGAHRHRSTDAVAALSALVLDFDADLDLDRLHAAARSLGAAAVHTSWSHTPDRPKARLVAPLARAVPVEAWPDTWAAADRWARSLGLSADAACKDVARFYLLPCLPADAGPDRIAAASTVRFDGAWLDPDELVRVWAPPAPAPPVPPRREPATWDRGADLDPDRDRRRADALLEARTRAVARDVADGAPVGRRLYGLAADVARLAAAGLVDAARWMPEIVAAGCAAGLAEREARRVVAQGVRRAERDGLPWIWPD